MSTKINLHLKDHCIETEARNEFKRYMDEFFNTDDPAGEIDDKINLLRDFIETTDFTKLRSSDKRLSGDIEAEVTLIRNNDGKIKITIIE